MTAPTDTNWGQWHAATNNYANHKTTLGGYVSHNCKQSTRTENGGTPWRNLWIKKNYVENAVEVTSVTTEHPKSKK